MMPHNHNYSITTALSPHPHAHLRTDSEAVDSISILNPVSRFSRTPKMVTAAVLYAEGERVLYAEGERVRARVFVHPSSAGASAARARAADANMLTVNHSRVSSLPPSQAHGMVSPPPVNINVWSEVALRPTRFPLCCAGGRVGGRMLLLARSCPMAPHSTPSWRRGRCCPMAPHTTKTQWHPLRWASMCAGGRRQRI
jgi:hypothetical protein